MDTLARRLEVFQGPRTVPLAMDLVSDLERVGEVGEARDLKRPSGSPSEHDSAHGYSG